MPEANNTVGLITRCLLFLILVLVIVWQGCSFHLEYELKENEKPQFKDLSDNCTYGVFDGHQYVRWGDGNRGSVCHSPKCWCLTNKVEVIR